MTAETRLEWLISHRGEPCVNAFLTMESKKMDRDRVEETLSHIWAGFYEQSDPAELIDREVCKRCYAHRRERKIEDNRRHQRRLAIKRGAM